mmetsp:Transcript_3838/g.5897  ORF Transcript_3838/g.5897 Transcript_3838/m.5897 type:complete len:278 (-) Transcript_3838:199-1032(-)
MNHEQIRYDLRRNPPYQINYRSKRAGKHITASKRRITFQFGFSSAEAIASGLTEVNCRGEEHEVVLVWSHISGKRELYMDGKPIHMSKGPRGNTKFQFTWGIGPHVLKIVANFKDQTKNFERQFDLLLDGITFFRFYKIYQLGRSSSTGGSISSSRAPSKEYSYRGAAYKDEEENSTSHKNIPSEVNVKLVDLFDQPSIATLSLASSGSTLSEDEFCPKSFHSVSNTILSAYNQPTMTSKQVQSQNDNANGLALVPTNVPTKQWSFYDGIGPGFASS